ncbi:FRG domain-containing protein, partial [Yersinia sp. 2544 StPb PI]|uniref:FRG domain-containing protein n=1 Tax=Yersinia sp. 2544 StPb PI TaxID=3117409 RepID=UPI003B28037E
ELWFRGVTNKNYSLTPGFVRANIKINIETTSVLDFINCYQNYHPKVENPWELYSLMQHYGFPTRLLDWSTSMIIALYFALDGEPSKDEQGKEIERVVWAMKTGEINRFNIMNRRTLPTALGRGTRAEKYLPIPLRLTDDHENEFESNPLAFRVPLSNRRINAQKGCFTIHGSNNEGIEKVMVDNGIGSDIYKFIFNETTASKMRSYLHRMQINEDDIYQDLNSLSRRIIRSRMTPRKSN